VALLAAAPALAHSPIAGKRAEAELVWAQIQQLNVSLGQADERLNLANLQLARVQQELALNRRKLEIARHNLDRSQKVIAQRLVTLYRTPQTSTLEVILGASSLDDLLTRVDTANRVSSLDAEVLTQVTTFKSAVQRYGRALARARAVSERLVARREAEERSIATQLAERRTLLVSIQDQIARLEAEQRARELAAAMAARARIIAAQAAAQQSYATSIVGASAATPEGAAVIPPGGHTGVVGVAMSELGTPYSWGGASPGGFDCSGLVAYAYGKEGISLPHSSYALWNVGVSVPRDQLEPGDLVFFNGLGHMGIYVGGDSFIHAPHTGDVVKISTLNGSYGSS
jgi:cell wall-associated NlpC family hydrolase